MEEVNDLSKNGLTIGNSFYKFKLKAIVADTPARAFIKCCKGHTGYYACERCQTRGVSIETKKSRKRIYPEVNSKHRTMNSFKEKETPDHHLPGLTSPLLKIAEFDIVGGVVLDYMHLLCIGVMKTLYDKWLNSRYICRLSNDKRDKLQKILLSISDCVPCEFQRKKFDLNDIVNWKATQYRFSLFYTGIFMITSILPYDQARHYSLFFYACRILSHHELSTNEIYLKKAQKYLEAFFVLMPTYYGDTSQFMNFHNLIHLCDDIKYMEAPMSMFSSFPFESYLGKIKKLVRTPVNPLAQVSMRLAELELNTDLIIKRNIQLDFYGEKKNCTCVQYRNFTIKTVKPDNIVLLNTGKIFVVANIFKDTQQNLVCMSGYLYNKSESAIFYPDESNDIGIFKISLLSSYESKIFLKLIVAKCIIFTNENETYAIRLLHN